VDPRVAEADALDPHPARRMDPTGTHAGTRARTHVSLGAHVSRVRLALRAGLRRATMRTVWKDDPS
jgi:hypothetical protein